MRLEGPPVVLPTVSVQTMALALHELATNAQKHGALSPREGTLSVGWQVTASDDEAPRLVLDWREAFGSSIPPDGPPRSGYGRELIERALPYQLGAKTSLGVNGSEVRCRIELQLDIDQNQGRSQPHDA